ncbi:MULTISPECIES: transcriptional regulator domain-containing protein [unclassified Rhizobium]|uniref:transcriptional regulator domain-containing protein n=1 Tax=unclassified Rhizobium TaxID=2613769 RepID=UPI00381B112D
MKPDTSRWHDSDAYDFFDTLPIEGLAWECLRRHEPYQQHYRTLVRTKQESVSFSPDVQRRWGLRFPGTTRFVGARTRGALVSPG